MTLLARQLYDREFLKELFSFRLFPDAPIKFTNFVSVIFKEGNHTMKQVRTLFSLLLLINHYHEGYAQTCSDSTKKFEITKSNGTKKNTSCDWARRKPNKTSWRCKIPEVKENCPKTCTNCCQDTTEPFIIMKTGKETNCVWVAEKNTEGRCQKAPTNLNCAVTCGKCTQHPTPEPAPPTSAPSQGPTLSTEIKCLNGNPFKITLMNMGTNTAYDEVFVVAKTRWESIIKCDLSDEASIGGDWFRGNFNSNFNGAVDDVLIGYEFKHIDGFSNKLGYAGPTYIRSTGSVVSGVMVFDEDDFLSMSDGKLDNRRKTICVLTHSLTAHSLS